MDSRSTQNHRSKTSGGPNVGINPIGPWKTMAAVEWETLKWVDWFNNCRLLAPIGYIPPSEAEERYYAQFNTLDMVA